MIARRAVKKTPHCQEQQIAPETIDSSPQQQTPPQNKIPPATSDPLKQSVNSRSPCSQRQQTLELPATEDPSTVYPSQQHKTLTGTKDPPPATIAAPPPTSDPSQQQQTPACNSRSPSSQHKGPLPQQYIPPSNNLQSQEHQISDQQQQSSLQQQIPQHKQTAPSPSSNRLSHEIRKSLIL